ncbi:MAG: DUF721 domain-containing protein [Bacteroidales bacterium]|jgi:hypothetical protein|nr:DUF721 domain-containing protein [Bacteroidales bacterium]
MYNSIKIDDALSLMIKRTGLENKFEDAKVIHTAKKIIPADIMHYVQRMFIKNKILYIQVSSPAAKNNILYRQTAITEAINTAVGRAAIEKTVLL